MLLAAALVEVVVLEKHGGRQDDVCHRGGFGHELFVHADEQVFTGKALMDQIQIRGDRHRVGVLDKERRDRRPVAQIARITRQHGADPGLIEQAHGGVARIEAVDQGAVPVKNSPVVVKRAAAAVLPSAGQHRNARRRVHIDRAVPLPREAMRLRAQARRGAPSMRQRLMAWKA